MPNNPKQPPLPLHETATLRLIDASINRATEGLRVIEDFVRFVQDDGLLSQLTKTVRHDLARLVSGQTSLDDSAQELTPQKGLEEKKPVFPIPSTNLLDNPQEAPWAAISLHGARETVRDVGTQITTTAENCRDTPLNVCAASFQRVKQALRSLEEYSKLATPHQAAPLEALRYRIYTLERCVTLATASRDRLQAARLCVLVDGGGDPKWFATLVSGLIAAGVGMIQLRDKRLDDATLVARARSLVELTRLVPQTVKQNGLQTLAIINDRPDIAAVAHADGVHLGQEDLPVKDARMLIGPRALIGVSAHSIDHARRAVLDGANYLGVGPTFPSTTKAFATYPGLELLEQVAREIGLTAYAIGGIDAGNLQAVLATGIHHFAVSGAVIKAANPGVEADKLLKIVNGYVEG